MSAPDPKRTLAQLQFVLPDRVFENTRATRISQRITAEARGQVGVIQIDEPDADALVARIVPCLNESANETRPPRGKASRRRGYRRENWHITPPCTASQVRSTRLLSGIACPEGRSKKSQYWWTCETRRKFDSLGDRTGKPTC